MTLRTAAIVAFGLALAMPGASFAQEDATEASEKQPFPDPAYVQLLTLPTSGDRLDFPIAVHADLHADEIFVVDRNRVVIFDHRGVFLYEIPGGQKFRSARDIAVDPDGFIYLVSPTPHGNEILHLDFDGLDLGRVIPTLEDGSVPEGFLPQSIAMSPDGTRLFVVDSANHRLWIMTPAGAVIRAVDISGGYTGEELRERFYEHVDVYGDVVLLGIPDVGSIWLFDLDGEKTGHVGVKGTAPCQSWSPVSAAIDRNGNLVMIDRQRIIGMVWDPRENKCLMEFSGIGTAPGRMYRPRDMALDNFGRIYISQGFEGRVQVFEGHVPAYNPDRKRRRRRQGDTE